VVVCVEANHRAAMPPRGRPAEHLQFRRLRKLGFPSRSDMLAGIRSFDLRTSGYGS
jgi:hypothetical protein